MPRWPWPNLFNNFVFKIFNETIYDSKNDVRKKLQLFYFVKICTLVLKYVKIDRF